MVFLSQKLIFSKIKTFLAFQVAANIILGGGQDSLPSAGGRLKGGQEPVAPSLYKPLETYFGFFTERLCLILRYHFMFKYKYRYASKQHVVI